MKQEPKFKVRGHKALFDNSLPFRNKVEKSKKDYTRKLKHKKVVYD